MRSVLAISLLLFVLGSGSPHTGPGQELLDAWRTEGSRRGISVPLFAALERMSRLVDIAYCVGSTGLWPPFSCASRCKDFPTLRLAATWNTGALMSDSCGYIAVDHPAQRPPQAPSGPGGNPHVTMASGKGAIIVAFRGTYSITNTVVDLSTVPQEYVPYPSPDEGSGQRPEEPKHRCTNCTVHMGFLSSWRTARRSVMPSLKILKTQNPDYVIHLVGHSLGGAVAALAALELKVILGWNHVTVTTFGEPRVGNEGFVRYLDQVFDLQDAEKIPEQWTYRRVTHVDDPVPLLPLTEWGYRSHAGEIFISKTDLAPAPEDIWPCNGDYDHRCIAGSAGEASVSSTRMALEATRTKHASGFPSRLKLWQLLYAHRDYFWRLGLCIPGGDPVDWGRDRHRHLGDEL